MRRSNYSLSSAREKAKFIKVERKERIDSHRWNKHFVFREPQGPRLLAYLPYSAIRQAQSLGTGCTGKTVTCLTRAMPHTGYSNGP